MPGDAESSARLRKITGTYFQVLGWISVATIVQSLAGVLLGTGSLNLDLSWLLWFWLGRSLKAGSPAARKWAIALFVFISVVSVGLLIVPDSTARFGGHEFRKPQPAYFAITGGIWIAFAIPGILLLGRRGQAAFRKPGHEQDVGAHV